MSLNRENAVTHLLCDLAVSSYSRQAHHMGSVTSGCIEVTLPTVYVCMCVFPVCLCSMNRSRWKAGSNSATDAECALC